MKTANAFEEIKSLHGFSDRNRLTRPECLHFLQYLLRQDVRLGAFATLLLMTGLEAERLERARCGTEPPVGGNVIIDPTLGALRYDISACRSKGDNSDEWRSARYGEMILLLPLEIIRELTTASSPFEGYIVLIKKAGKKFGYKNCGPRATANRLSASFEIVFAAGMLTRLEKALSSGRFRRDTQTSSHYAHVSRADFNRRVQDAFIKFVARAQGSEAHEAAAWLRTWRFPEPASMGRMEFLPVARMAFLDLAGSIRAEALAAARDWRQTARKASLVRAAELAWTYEYLLRKVCLALRGIRRETREAAVGTNAVVIGDKASYRFRERKLVPVPTLLQLQTEHCRSIGSNAGTKPLARRIRSHGEWIEQLTRLGVVRDELPRNFGRHYVMSRLHGRVQETALSAMLNHFHGGFGMHGPFSCATWNDLIAAANYLDAALSADGIKPLYLNLKA